MLIGLLIQEIGYYLVISQPPDQSEYFIIIYALGFIIQTPIYYRALINLNLYWMSLTEKNMLTLGYYLYMFTAIVVDILLILLVFDEIANSYYTLGLGFDIFLTCLLTLTEAVVIYQTYLNAKYKVKEQDPKLWKKIWNNFIILDIGLAINLVIILVQIFMRPSVSSQIKTIGMGLKICFVVICFGRVKSFVLSLEQQE
jgi:hypothetical protein